MKYLPILLILLFSCSMEKKLAKYCPLCVQKDSTSVVTQVRDTTIIIPGETIYIQDTLYCDSLGHVISKLGERLRDKDGKIITLETRLKNNVYTSKAEVRTIYKTIKGNTVYSTKLVTKTLKPEKIKYIPWWVNFLAVVGGIVMIIILVYVIIQIIKKSVMPI
jgi:hypothetical protein